MPEWIGRQGNSFLKPKSKDFIKFYQALKTAKKITIKVFSSEMNPDTAKEELKLNRSIDFKLGNNTFLDLPVNCK